MKKEPADPVGAHLEYYGYTTRMTPDGWSVAGHPTRPDFCYRRFPFGWRVGASFILGKSLGSLDDAYLVALNGINERADLVKFVLSKDSDGDVLLRARAFFHCDYRKRDFGVFMEAWHSDLELIRELPRVPEDVEQEGPSEEAEEGNVRLPN
jgi:hypothetical protein